MEEMIDAQTWNVVLTAVIQAMGLFFAAYAIVITYAFTSFYKASEKSLNAEEAKILAKGFRGIGVLCRIAFLLMPACILISLFMLAAGSELGYNKSLFSFLGLGLPTGIMMTAAIILYRTLNGAAMSTARLLGSTAKKGRRPVLHKTPRGRR